MCMNCLKVQPTTHISFTSLCNRTPMVNFKKSIPSFLTIKIELFLNFLVHNRYWWIQFKVVKWVTFCTGQNRHARIGLSCKFRIPVKQKQKQRTKTRIITQNKFWILWTIQLVFVDHLDNTVFAIITTTLFRSSKYSTLVYKSEL